MNKIIMIVIAAGIMTGCTVRNASQTDTMKRTSTPESSAPERFVYTVEAPEAPAMPEPVEPKQKKSAASKQTPELIQKALIQAKIYKGKIDGKIGPQTQKAIEEFQRRHGLKVDGKVGQKTWEKMKKYL